MIPKNKNISVLHPHVNKKGWAVKMMIYLSNFLVLEWNNVKFYTFSYDENLFSEYINFEVVVWNKTTIAKKIKKSDYIIAWNSPMHFVWVLSKLIFRSRAKLIWRQHHYPWYYGKNTNFLILMKRYVEKFSLKYVDELIANSKYLQTSLKKIYSRDSKVLYPIIENIFVESYSVRSNSKQKYIFSYGRRTDWKNIDQVFETYKYLQGRIPNLVLLVWWIWEELEKYKNKFKTDKNVSFLWLLDNNSIIINLKKSHVFLFPSKIDSFWMSVLEAQASWVPVVAFDLAWIREIVINEKTGFLVDNSEDFSLKVYSLLNNNNLLKSFSENLKNMSIAFNEDSFKKQIKNTF